MNNALRHRAWLFDIAHAHLNGLPTQAEVVVSGTADFRRDLHDGRVNTSAAGVLATDRIAWASGPYRVRFSSEREAAANGGRSREVAQCSVFAEDTCESHCSRR